MPGETSRRHFLARAATVTAGALVGGAVLTERALHSDATLPVARPHRASAASSAETQTSSTTTTSTSTTSSQAATTQGTAGTDALASAASEGSSDARFMSRPDLTPPLLDVTKAAPKLRDGLIFLAPYSGGGQYGPMIVDRTGELVYFQPLTPTKAANFRMQHLHGQRVLTYWDGHITSTGHGLGDYVILDRNYNELKRIQPVGHLQGDHHEFLITPQGTALFTIFHIVPANLSAYGGPSNGHATESIVQEVDIDTGKLLLQWNAIDHVSLAESYQGEYDPWDYVHCNSIDIDLDGHLLISARNTWTIYKVHRHTGRIIWRLGGKKSDFSLGPGAHFQWQHDFRRHTNGLYSVFDNGASAPGSQAEPRSRGLMLRINEAKRTVNLVRAYVRPRQPSLATSQGNLQLLEDGNVFIGWGSLPYLSEFRPQGQLRLDVTMPDGGQSYRAFRDHWVGLPKVKPAVAVKRLGDNDVHVYASWNGATDVAHWSVLAGTGDGKLKVFGTGPNRGFETQLHAAIPAAPRMLIAAQALDSKMRPLGTSTPLVA